MKAVRIERHGGHEVIAVEDIETPTPGAHEIRVKNAACGVNFIDTYHRTGLYKIALPSGLGQEGAGVVDAVGADVSRFKVGDRVA